MPCMSVIEPPETVGELKLLSQMSAAGDLEEGGVGGSGSDCSFYRFSKEPEMLPSPAESSSIGMNSDEDEEEGDDEIQGPLRGGLKASMDSLEEALPMRRGISSFYNGKSKSFASLTDASSHPSIKGIVKPETPYSRRRRNLLAYTLLSENNHHKNTKTSHLIKTHGGGISKKPVSFASSSSSNRATLALAVAMANTSSSSKTNTGIMGVRSRVGGSDDCTSPLSLRSFCHWRSFSLVDLQQCQPVVSSNLRAPDRIS